MMYIYTKVVESRVKWSKQFLLGGR